MQEKKEDQGARTKTDFVFAFNPVTHTGFSKKAPPAEPHMPTKGKP